jgi:hypothetical protein
MVKFIINRPDKDKPLEWDVSNMGLRHALMEIMDKDTDFEYVDKIEFTFNEKIMGKRKSNSKNYAFPNKYA